MRKVGRKFLSNTIKDTSTIMRNPSLHIQAKGYAYSIAKKTSCSHYFLHSASLHHLTFSIMIFTLVYTWLTTNCNILTVSATTVAVSEVNTVPQSDL